jgi:hypothetical protein
MASYDAGSLIGMYTAGQDRRIAMDDRKRKLETEATRKAALSDLFVSGGRASSPVTPPASPSLQDQYVGAPVTAAPASPVAQPAPDKFILPKDADVMRKSLGSAKYEAWRQKNGLVEYDPAQGGSTPSISPTVPAEAANPLANGIPASSEPPPVKINQQALAKLLVIDLGAGTNLINAFAKMDEGQRKSMENKFNAMGSVAYRLHMVPVKERGRDFQGAIDYLRAHGWTDQELQKADLSDKGLGMYTAGAVDVKTLMTETRQAAGDAETARHNRVSEGQGESRIGIAQGALDVARGREGRIATGKKDGGDTSSASTGDLLRAAGL